MVHQIPSYKKSEFYKEKWKEASSRAMLVQQSIQFPAFLSGCVLRFVIPGFTLAQLAIAVSFDRHYLQSRTRGQRDVSRSRIMPLFRL